MRFVCSSVTYLWLLGVLAFGQGGTARLTGKLIDITGAGIWQAQIKLESDRGDQYSAEPNSEGEFAFSHLLPGEYNLATHSAGFLSSTVRGIKITNSETKTLPPLRLSIPSHGVCNYKPEIKYIRFVDEETRTGDLGGRVELEQGPIKTEPQGIAGAQVKLRCGKIRVCGTTTTNQDGEFRFSGLNPREYSVEVRRTGHYLQKEAGYTVDAGRESIYYPIYLEICVHGDCDPSKRPMRVVLCF
jgi:hypothetical protein